MEYYQRVIIKFLLNEKADARDIADRLQALFGEHAYKLRMIEFWIAEVWLGPQGLCDEIRSRKLPMDDLDPKIMAISDKSPFELVHSITETLCIAQSIVLLHFHNSVEFRSFHVHWMLQLLMHDSLEKRMEWAQTMLPVLHAV
jgi:hypothetical protein